MIRRKSKTALLFSFGFSIIILIVGSVISYKTVTNLLESQRWVSHTDSVLIRLENIISRMKDAETSQRGFLLTGSEDFLSLYEGADSDILQYINEVKILTSDNVTQQKDFPLLTSLVLQKFSLMRTHIQSKRKDEPLRMDLLSLGGKKMDSIRVMITIMKDREQVLLINRTSIVGKTSKEVSWAILITTGLSVILTILFYLKIKQEYEKQAAIQDLLAERDVTLAEKIEQVSGMAKHIAAGNYESRIEIDGSNKQDDVTT